MQSLVVECCFSGCQHPTSGASAMHTDHQDCIIGGGVALSSHPPSASRLVPQGQEHRWNTPYGLQKGRHLKPRLFPPPFSLLGRSLLQSPMLQDGHADCGWGRMHLIGSAVDLQLPMGRRCRRMLPFLPARSVMGPGTGTGILRAFCIRCNCLGVSSFCHLFDG